MLLLSTVCFAQIKVKKTYVIHEKDTLRIINKELLYTDTILYLENDISIRVSGLKLYYYSPKTYTKYRYIKCLHQFIEL